MSNGGTGTTPFDRREDALVREWAPFAYSIARHYYLPGHEDKDVRQEALIGLLAGLRQYDGTSPLRPFLGLVISRRLITRLRLANGLKHRHLNLAASLDQQIELDNGDAGTLHELVGSAVDGEEHLEHRRQLRCLTEAMGSLTPLERRWLLYAVNGGEYSLEKTGDNAVQRARGKLRRAAA